MQYLTLKLSAALAFFCLGIIFGFLPILWQFIDICKSCIVGNVEIVIDVYRCQIRLAQESSSPSRWSICFRIFSQANQDFEDWKSDNNYTDFFPLTYTLVVIGYTIVLFIQRVVFGQYKIEELQNQQEYELAKSSNDYSTENNDQLRQQLRNKQDQYSSRRSFSVVKKKELCNGLFGPILLLLGLGMHSIFAGLSLGIANDKKEVIDLFYAVASHKWAAAMANDQGASYAKKVKYGKRGDIILVLIFSFITPVGVFIGIGLDGTSVVVSFVFLSLAIGMFIYVAVEVSTQEFVKKKDRWIKFALMDLGIAVVVASTFLE